MGAVDEIFLIPIFYWAWHIVHCIKDIYWFYFILTFSSQLIFLNYWIEYIIWSRSFATQALSRTDNKSDKIDHLIKSLILIFSSLFTKEKYYFVLWLLLQFGGRLYSCWTSKLCSTRYSRKTDKICFALKSPQSSSFWLMIIIAPCLNQSDHLPEVRSP